MGADQRVVTGEIHMIGDHHHIARIKSGVKRSCCICDHKLAHTKRICHAEREGNVTRAPAFIKVQPALHNGHMLTTKLTKNQPSGVRWGGGYGKTGNIFVIQRMIQIHLIDDPGKASSKDHQNLHRVGNMLLDHFFRLRDFFQFVLYHCHSLTHLQGCS